MSDSTSIDIKSLHDYSLIDLIGIDDLQRLQDSFARANRVASTITDIHGVPITRPSNHCRVCTLIRETVKGQEKCNRSGSTLGTISLQSQTPNWHYCQSIGFVDAAAPIVVDNVHIANWLIGQNWVGEVDEKRIIAYAEEIETDADNLLSAFREMNKISKEEFKEKLDFLWLMANQISFQAYQHIRNQSMITSLEKSKQELKEYKTNLEILVERRTMELENAIREIKQISVRDSLTGCFNRGGIDKKLPKEMKRAQRYTNPISIIICDLDHFKNINDTFGHQCGDHVLKSVVNRMQELIRDDLDWVARYGGEEFLLVMPMTDITGAAKTAERVRKAIAEISYDFGGGTVHVTASFGVSGIESWQTPVPDNSVNYEKLLNTADAYLYRAKRGGRNQVISGPSPLEDD